MAVQGACSSNPDMFKFWHLGMKQWTAGKGRMRGHLGWLLGACIRFQEYEVFENSDYL
jgi:hypothetical protein